MKIRLRLEACADLAHIHAHIAQDNPAAASAVIGRIEKAVERLSLFPSSGRRGVVAGTRELVVPSLPYVVVYRQDEAFVDIISVVHGAQRRP